MNKLKMIEEKLSELAVKSQQFNFPDFLRVLRRAHGLARRQVCHDLNFSEMRMYYLEHGYFKKELPTQDISMLAEYYGVPVEVMMGKYQVFIDLDQGKPQPGYSYQSRRRKSEDTN